MTPLATEPEGDTTKMHANWNQSIAELRVAARRRGFSLSAHCIADGRWHETDDGAGAYLLFRDQFLAVLDSNVNDLGPLLWRPDDRILTYAQRARIAAAIAYRSPCPIARLGTGNAPQNQPIPVAVSSAFAVDPLDKGSDGPSGAGILGLAVRFLTTRLSRESVPAIQLRAEAAVIGISIGTLRRAAKELEITPTRKGFGGVGYWEWRLP